MGESILVNCLSFPDAPKSETRYVILEVGPWEVEPGAQDSRLVLVGWFGKEPDLGMAQYSSHWQAKRRDGTTYLFSGTYHRNVVDAHRQFKERLAIYQR